MPEENIDEIIQEILSEENKPEGEEVEEIITSEELYECPVCHHTVSEEAKFCPYCFAVFDEKINYKMLMETLIGKLKSAVKLATEENIPPDEVKRAIAKAKKYALIQDFSTGYAPLQKAYLYITGELVKHFKKRLEKYELVVGMNNEIRELYNTAGAYLDEWEFESFIETMKELKDKASKVSKEMKEFLEKLEEVENAIEIAKKLNIDVSKSLSVVDTAKDMSDSKKYVDAIGVLDEALTPIKDEIDNTMKSFLKIVKEELVKATYNGKSNSKEVMRLIRELKIYRDEGNYVKVLKKMGDINEILLEEK